MDAVELRARVADIGWHHRIDLGSGVVTPGGSCRDIPLNDTMPDFAGRSVLDIGCWDGYYSFLAERRGAARVVALDHYAWCVDLAAREEYWRQCAAAGVLPDHGRDETDFYRPEMPGRRAFDFARQVLQSAVEPMLGDFMKVDLDALGEFDVVLYLGVLYHMREPLLALQRVRRATRGVAVIETVGIDVPERTAEPLLSFFAGNELSGDYGNWYATSETALHGLCRAAGFTRVETVVGPPPLPSPPSPLHRVARAARAAQLRLANREPEVAGTRHYRLVVHARP